MEWLTANWFWVLIFILFIGMHLFGIADTAGMAGMACTVVASLSDEAMKETRAQRQAR